MKRKYFILVLLLIVAIIILFVFTFSKKEKYRIIISIIDDRSPDRILTVYNNKDEKVKVNEIRYLDGTVLCMGYNTTTYYGNLENIEELIIILENKKEFKAKVIQDEVKLK